MDDNLEINADVSEKQITVQPKPRLSRWKTFGIVALAALSTVVYVSNVLAVDRLLEEVHTLKKQKESVVNKKELLKSRINQLQAAERIIPIATEKLKMIKAEKAPEQIP
jgi:hypothetical protein